MGHTAVTHVSCGASAVVSVWVEWLQIPPFKHFGIHISGSAIDTIVMIVWISYKVYVKISAIRSYNDFDRVHGRHNQVSMYL